MGIIARKQLPPQGEIDTYFICGDLHSRHLHLPTFLIMLKLSRWSIGKPKLIINGDLADFHFLMPKSPDFKKWIKRSDGIDEFFIPQYQEENAVVNSILDKLQSHFSEITLLMGNHDKPRVDELKVRIPPSYRPNFDLERDWKLRERNIDWLEYNDWLDIGKLSITHGMYHNTNCHQSHTKACNWRNNIFSHVHRFEVRAFIGRGDTVQSWSLPSMADLNPYYIKNREQNWSNGFGILQMRDNGTFNFNVYQIWDDKLVLPNGVILHGT